jgi:hypothetical protein
VIRLVLRIVIDVCLFVGRERTVTNSFRSIRSNGRFGKTRAAQKLFGSGAYCIILQDEVGDHAHC